ncbi:MAG: DUF6260 family protein [Sulfuricaulis sp.]|nr:DUF6260 family protein [Sulfuricaulis sp.]
MHDDKRTTGETQLTNVIERAMMEPGGLTIPNMRGPGFRAMEAMIAADGGGFRALAPLPERSQLVLDTAVVEVGLERLTFAADIMAAGLTYNLTDPLSITQLAWNKSNKVGAAQRTMSPSARGENKLPAVLEDRLPIYLTTDNFSLDIRTLRMSQRVGLPLDTSLIKQCTRSVNEAVEDAAINGATTIDGQDLQVAGYKAPGIVNATNAATKALATATWDATPVGTSILADVQAMIVLLQANKKYGPYRLYVNTTVGGYLDSDYDTTNPSRGLTIKERLAKLEGLQAIRTADLMPAAKVVLVQMTSDVVDMVVGQKPTVIPYTSLDGFTFHNLVMAIMIPRVRSDYDSKSGICVGTIA